MSIKKLKPVENEDGFAIIELIVYLLIVSMAVIMIVTTIDANKKRSIDDEVRVTGEKIERTMTAILLANRYVDKYSQIPKEELLSYTEIPEGILWSAYTSDDSYCISVFNKDSGTYDTEQNAFIKTNLSTRDSEVGCGGISDFVISNYLPSDKVESIWEEEDNSTRQPPREINKISDGKDSIAVDVMAGWTENKEIRVIIKTQDYYIGDGNLLNAKIANASCYTGEPNMDNLELHGEFKDGTVEYVITPDKIYGNLNHGCVIKSFYLYAPNGNVDNGKSNWSVVTPILVAPIEGSAY